MGIFDSYFNPQGYQGQGYQGMAGILAQLPMLQAQAGASAGFPGDNGSLPNNAQPMAGPPLNIVPQAPAAPAAPQQEPGMGDRLMAGFQGFARGGGGLLPALANAAQGVATGKRADPQGMALDNQNQTVQALVQRGFDQNLAKTVASDPGLLRAVLPQVMGIGGQTDDIKNYEYGRRQEPGLTWQQFQQRKRAGAGEYALQPIYGQDENGNTVVMQLGKGGDAVKSRMPDGVKINAGVEKIDLGTQWGIMDKRSGQIVGYQPKDIVGKEAAEERGKAQGLAQATLPNVIANAEQTLATIDSIKNDPYRERGTGVSSLFNAIPATGGFDFAQKVEQLKGKSFLEAYQSLKGGGAITEIEGKKAENAIARLNVRQSEQAFNQALDELREVVTAGISRAKQRAGGGSPAAAGDTATSPAPAPGGYKVLGVR